MGPTGGATWRFVAPNSVGGYAFGMTEEWHRGGPIRVGRGSPRTPAENLGSAAALALALLAAAPVLAAEAEKTGPSEVVFLVQIILLLSVGRLMGEVMQRMGQPAVMGQLLAGLLLGPSVLGALFAEPGAQARPARGFRVWRDHLDAGARQVVPVVDRVRVARRTTKTTVEV